MQYKYIAYSPPIIMCALRGPSRWTMYLFAVVNEFRQDLADRPFGQDPSDEFEALSVPLHAPQGLDHQPTCEQNYQCGCCFQSFFRRHVHLSLVLVQVHLQLGQLGGHLPLLRPQPVQPRQDLLGRQLLVATLGGHCNQPARRTNIDEIFGQNPAQWKYIC